MEFKVEITPQAEADIEQAFQNIHDRSPGNAVAWRHQLYEKIQTLRTLPERCSLAPENEHVSSEVRQILFGWYRILFIINGDVVRIVTVRHGARRFLTPDQLEGL